MNYRAIRDHIIIEVEQAPDQTAGGIILPDVAKRRPVRGRVLSVGPGILNKKGRPEPMPACMVGDTVVFHESAVSEAAPRFLERGERVVVNVRGRDVLGVVS